MRDEYLPEGQRTITYSDGKTATLSGTGTDLALYVLDYWEETSNETYGGGQKGIQRPKTYITVWMTDLPITFSLQPRKFLTQQAVFLAAVSLMIT